MRVGTAAFLAVSILSWGSTTQADDHAVTVDVCTDDSAEDSSRFVERLNRQLEGSHVQARVGCGGRTADGSQAAVVASFARDAVGGRVELISGIDGRTARVIPWLNDEHKPLATTLKAGKTASFGLVLENLLLDFESVRLRLLPPPTEKPQPAVLSPIASKEPKPQNEPLRLRAIALRGGLEWMALRTQAPAWEADIAWGTSSWQATAHAAGKGDSNFRIHQSEFETRGYGVRLGVRRRLLSSDRLFWDGEIAAVGHLSAYSRQDVQVPKTERWLDVGAAIINRGGVRLAGIVYFVLDMGIQGYPTARLVRLRDGGKERANAWGLTMTGGLGLSF